MTTLRLGADAATMLARKGNERRTAYDGVEALDVDDVPARCHPARQAMPRLSRRGPPFYGSLRRATDGR
jgi:hypothetical protein